MKTHQIPIEAFLVALRMMKVEDVDADETQCIIANLIYEGKIKGYISHQHQKLVVSKQNAFPALPCRFDVQIFHIHLFPGKLCCHIFLYAALETNIIFHFPLAFTKEINLE